MGNKAINSIEMAALLKHPLLSHVQLVAGKNGIANKIVWINLMEVFDDFSKIEQGELVVTTAFAWDKYCGDGSGIVAALLERGAAGLAFQAGVYQAEIPFQLLEDADSLSFPVLSLPSNFTFRTISHALADFLRGNMSEAQEEAISETNIGIKSSLHAGKAEVLKKICLDMYPDLYEVCLKKAVEDMPDWPEVRDTLSAFFRCRGSLSEAAAALNIHRHTVRNRLQRFVSISGVDMADYSQRLELELALWSDYEQKSAAVVE